MFVRDSLSGRMVAFSSKRSKRPHRPTICPFCPGAEALTPPAVLVLPDADWRVRVFPNAFPVVSGKNGRHEVIVETPRHGEWFENYSGAQLALLFGAFQQRFAALSKARNARYVLLFKNFGDKSGASIPHEHSQILSLPFVPDAVKTEWKNRKALEVGMKRPALIEDQWFKVICPEASFFPYQVRVLAKDKNARFESLSQEQGVALLTLLQSVIRKVKAAQGAPDYTVVFHAAPKGKVMRFFVDVMPRKAVWGGVELGSGVLVNFKEPRLALEELSKA